MTPTDYFGPIEYVAVQFPTAEVPPGGFRPLLHLVESGTVRVLDVEFVSKSIDGEVSIVAAQDIEGAGDVVGAASGLLDRSDVDLVGLSMAAGTLAVILVYEERALLPVLDAWTDGGGQTLVEGHLSLDELAAVLDDTEVTA